MDPNYGEWCDFHGIDPARIELVREYLKDEWMVDLDGYPAQIRDKALALAACMYGSSTVPAIAGAIAMEVLPI
jgi:hypothetical protein